MNKIPRHVGIIINGSVEWAKERNLSVENGYIKSFDVLKVIPGWIFEKGIREISFLLSLINDFNGREKNLNFLMKFAKDFFIENLDEFNQRGYQVIFSGEMDSLPGDLAEVFKQVSLVTKENVGGILNFCFNYSGRGEMIQAVKRIIEKKYETDQISESLIKKYLYQKELAYPDLIINTAGVQKMSGFLLWQSANSEFISINKYWPDFEKTDIDLILNKYEKISKKI